MSEGYVYILSNPSMPGLVKIGKTTREPAQRANELYQTGVPQRFEVEDWVLSPNCDVLEVYMHEEFEDCRVGGDREFFSLDIDVAQSRLASLLADQVSAWVDRYLPEHEVSLSDYSLNEREIQEMAEEVGKPPALVLEFFNSFRPEDLGPAIDRYEVWRRERAERISAMRSTESEDQS